VSRQTVDLLEVQLDEAWEFLRQRLDSLTDDEFFWRPVPNCWTVHQHGGGHWVIDYESPSPEPPPFTTIAWRLVHTAACKVMYHEYGFGAGRLAWDALDIPHTAADAMSWLESAHALLSGALKDLSGADLAELRPTNWGEWWPTWRIFWTMAAHDLHHGAEIGCLRDLYRTKDSPSREQMK
jgi:hypothetical protein